MASEIYKFERPNNPELLEYIVGNEGCYKTWTYDLKCQSLSKLINQWVSEIHPYKRSKRAVIRHLMSKLSSENSGDQALIVGRWDGIYTEDGKPPTHWINTSSIFDQRYKTGKPVRYGQCWCFAECMTSMLRYLNIPCRTVFGNNIMIDENLDGGIDMKEELRKDESDSSIMVHLSKPYINEMLTNLISGQGSKSELWDNLKIYDCGDSYWNIHYWNQVYIDDHWETIDPTPSVISNYDGKKILGPSSITIKKSNNIDYDRLFSMINAPYRFWAVETIIENDNPVDIPYVYSLVYPHSIKSSRYLKLPKINNIFSKKPTAVIKSKLKNIDITANYRVSDSELQYHYFSHFQVDQILYLQTVYLDSTGNVIKVNRGITSLREHRESNKEIIPECYLISCLAIELNDNPKWIAFCQYS